MVRTRVAAAALLLTLAGCAQTGAGGPGSIGVRPSGPPVINAAWRGCPAGAEQPGSSGFGLPRLDPGFTPRTAVVCRMADRKRPGGGTDTVAVEDRATDITALVSALRLPDQPNTSGNCPADGYLPPFLVLLDAAGRWVRPGFPLDGCSHPRPEMRAAYDHLPTTRVSSHLLGHVESDAAARSGCGPGYSDMAWAAVRALPVAAAAPSTVPAPDGPVRVCIFRVPPSEQGGNKPAGAYESSHTLTAARSTAVAREMARTGPAAPCTRSASRIAVFDHYTVAELDGCRLVLIGNTVRRGTPALAALLQ